MNNAKLKQLVAEAVALDRAIALHQEQLKSMKARLIFEAESRPRQASSTDGRGHAYVFEADNGCVARVSLPGPSLRAKIEGDGKTMEKLKGLTGRYFDRLFRQVLSYEPTDNFRSQAGLLMGRAAGRVIKLCETASRPRVSFETKETPVAEPA